MKTCSRCGKEGEDDLFRTGTNTCKECIKEYNKKYMAEHKKERKAYSDIYVKEHAQELADYRKGYWKQKKEVFKQENRNEIERLETKLREEGILI